MTPCKGSITVAIRQDIIGERGECAVCNKPFRTLIRRGNDKIVPIHEPVITDVALGYLAMAQKRKG